MKRAEGMFYFNQDQNSEAIVLEIMKDHLEADYAYTKKSIMIVAEKNELDIILKKFNAFN